MLGGQFFQKILLFFTGFLLFWGKKLAYEKQTALSSQFSTGGV